MATVVYGPDWWMTNHDRQWLVSAEAFAAFKQLNRGWPAKATSDADEALLARWRSTQRAAAVSELYPWRRQYLDRVTPGWHDPDTAATPTSPYRPGVPTPNPSGRYSELSEYQAPLALLGTGTFIGRVRVVTGISGAGKTTLLRRVQTLADQSNLMTVWGDRG